MLLSRIEVKNFRNFSELDIPLSGNVVVVGENRVGKSNLLYGIRLLLDPSLPDSSRQLGMSDFWDGLDELDSDTKIVISVEIKDFDNDLSVLALVTDFRLDDDPTTVRLTYEFRAKPDLDDDPTSDSDFEFICYGGESEAKRFGHELRRRLTMDFLPALRDAEGDLATWRRSPIRPLIENAFRRIDKKSLEEIAESIGETTARIAEFKEIKSLEKEISGLFVRMSGPKQDIKPSLGFSPTDPTRLYRNMRLLIDDGMRSISEASLGSANLVFLSLKTLEISQLISENARDYTFLAIEEPEAHLHPHLQRSVYRHLFESVDFESPISVFLTTHSPHIASVAPLRSIVLLKDTEDKGTIGCSTASIELTSGEADDLARYIDVTRAEMLFARGVILVEGDAERFLVPIAARVLDKPLDHLGITVCSVAGTNFIPYVKLLASLGIPFAVMTDWDDLEGYDNPLGLTRSLEIVSAIEQIRTGRVPKKLVDDLKNIEDPNEFCDRCAGYGVFSNFDTLEVDLFNDDAHRTLVAATLREGPFGAKRLGRVDEWEKSKKIDRAQFLSMVEEIGKGRFAQRLAASIDKQKPLQYIADAINFVADRV
ncbi:MAG: ATP-dependent nuclease [Pseudomonadota bacterium]